MPRLSSNLTTLSSAESDQQRGTADLTTFALDPSWALKRADTRALIRAYPSPPMSGSPPPPPSQKAATDTSDLAQRPLGHLPDAFQGGSTRPSSSTDPRSSHVQLPTQETYARLARHEPTERIPYGYQQQHPPQHEVPARPLSFPPQGLPSFSQPQPYIPTTGTSSQLGYAMTGRAQAPESQPYATSPKSQRKVKGHVASACVPCKRAHLRCDSQRPCSRCLSNGKESACHDVMHKKRGRPRLREDRETRYDASRQPLPHEGVPRPLYPQMGSDSSSEPPRYSERGPMVPADYARQTVPECVAYLSMNFEIKRVSEPFMQFVSLQHRRMLSEVVAPSEREKVARLHEQLSAEQKRREPNYLPPILDRGEQIFHSLGFNPEDVARYQLGPQDFMSFLAPDGHPRLLPFRLGLANQGSFYFVVLVLAVSPQPPHHAMAPHDRPPMPPGYPPPTQSLPPRPYYEPFQAGSAAHTRTHESQLPPRQVPGASGHVMATSGHGAGPGPLGPPAPYPPGRPDHSTHPLYQSPHGESSESQQGPRPSYQLPPIRAPTERMASGRDQNWPQRDERSGRVDIGGLIEKPEGPGRPH